MFACVSIPNFMFTSRVRDVHYLLCMMFIGVRVIELCRHFGVRGSFLVLCFPLYVCACVAVGTDISPATHASHQFPYAQSFVST